MIGGLAGTAAEGRRPGYRVYGGCRPGVRVIGGTGHRSRPGGSRWGISTSLGGFLKRGGFLKVADRDVLARFPNHVDTNDLGRCFTLTSHDFAEVINRRYGSGARVAERNRCPLSMFDGNPDLAPMLSQPRIGLPEVRTEPYR